MRWPNSLTQLSCSFLEVCHWGHMKLRCFRTTLGRGEVKSDGAGRKADQFIFSFPLPLLFQCLKSTYPFANVSLGPLKPLHRCEVLSLSTDTQYRGPLIVDVAVWLGFKLLGVEWGVGRAATARREGKWPLCVGRDRFGKFIVSLAHISCWQILNTLDIKWTDITVFLLKC